MQIIGVDIDEVLAETYKYFLEHVNNKVGDRILYFDDVIDFDFWNIPGVNLKKEDIMNLWYKTMSDHIIHISPVFGAFEKLKLLKNTNHKLVAVTGRDKTIEKETYNWLEKHYSGIFDEVFFASRGLAHQTKKSDLIKHLNIKIFFEDNIDYAEDIASIGVETYLFNKPWNKSKEVKHENIIRVDGWGEIEF